MRKKRRTLLTIAGLCIALVTGIIIVNAAPSNTRGRVAVDLSDFVYVDHDGGRSRGLSDEGNGTKYKLYYENYMISNHNNDGVTYRSGKTYDMTDVVKLEFSAYTQGSTSDKFMIYTTASTDKTFHGRDRDTINDAMYGGQSPAVSGKVYSFSNFSKQISRNTYSKEFNYTSFNTDNTYEDRHVFIAMSKDFEWAKSGIMLENNTYQQNTSGKTVAGGLNLMLKDHQITLLAPDKPKRIDKDNNEVINTTAYSDLSIKLNDGNSYAPNKPGHVFRDEEITLSYRWGAGVNGKVAGYNFYADKDKKTKLYQLNTTSGNIKFNADLIQTIENTSGMDLGDFYIEPIFQYDEAAIEVSSSVPETDQLEIKKSTSNSYDYVVYDKSSGNEVVGTIHLNKAKYVGDYLRIDYEPNSNYHGSYGVSTFLLSFCENKEQVNTTTNTAEFSPSNTAVDYNQQVQTKYTRILPCVKLNATLKLEDKITTFCNAKVQIDPAEVIYPADGVKPPGANKITYQYYTDADCTDQMADAPMNAGTYYVVATMPGDTNYYMEAKSNVATLTIEKAVPELSNIRGKKEIVYNQPLSMTDGVVGTAKGVTGSTVDGTFAWIDENEVFDAGYRTAEAVFTPTGIYANNYNTAIGYGLVVVKADAVTVTVENKTHTYNGAALAPNKVTVKGVRSGEDTGQDVELTYYKDSGCTDMLSEAPVYAGTYGVEATVYAEGNYNGGKAVGTVTIEKAKVNLLQTAYKDGSMPKAEYRVYVQGAKAEPKGTIKLQISYGGESHSLQTAQYKQDENQNYYAAFVVDEIKSGITPGVDVNISASYNNETDFQDYYSGLSSQSFYDGKVTKKETLYFDYGDESTKTYSWNDSFDLGLKPGDGDIAFKTVIADSDVAELEPDSEDTYNEGICITPKNAGTTYALTWYVRTVGGETESCYLMYEIVVKPADVTVALDDKTVVYDGHEVKAAEVAVSGTKIPTDGSLPEDMYITYSYYQDAACTENLTAAPTEPGTYYAIAKTNETRNYNAGSSAPATILVKKAQAEMSLASKLSTYDGNVQKVDDAVLTGTVPIDIPTEDNIDQDISVADAFVPVTGKVSYEYKDQNGSIVKDPISPGEYNVTAKMTGDKYYEDMERKASLLIVPDYARLTIKDVVKVYDGQPVEPEVIFAVDGESIPVPEDVYIEYGLQILRGDGITKDAPDQAGKYYSRAFIDKGNYWSAYSNLGEVIIERAEVDVVIPKGYEGEYDGNLVILDNAKVYFGEEDVTDSHTITYEYYDDENGSNIIEPPQYPGTYYVRAFTRGTRNFLPGESDLQTIVIEKRPVFLSELQVDTDAKVTGKAKNQEGEVVNGTFHVVDIESFWNLPAGTHQVEVAFVPDEAESRIYNGVTGFALYTVIPPKCQLTIGDVEKIYDGKPAEITMTFTVDGVEVLVPESTVTKYHFRFDKEGEVFIEGVPTDAGDYVIYGIVQDGEYKDIYSNLGHILIHKAQVKVTIPADYETEYNGKAVNLDTAIVTSGEHDVTKYVAVRYTYYSDAACTVVIDAPVSPGTYYAKAFVDETANVKAAESEAVKITIKKGADDGGKDPSDDGKDPDGGKDPSDDGKDPSDGGKDPSDGGKDPSDDDKDPSDGDKNPSDGGKDPSDGGKDPSDDGKDPSDDDKDPSDGGKDPSDDGKDPSDDDKDPSDGGKDPADGGKDPSDDDKDPSDDGKDPDGGKDPSDDGKDPDGDKDPSDDGKDPDGDKDPADDNKDEAGDDDGTDDRDDSDGKDDTENDSNAGDDSCDGKKEESPDTGDRTPLGTYAALLIMSIAAAFVLLRRRYFDR